MVDTSVEDPSYLIHNRALSYISYIGCALSLAGVVLMCGAFITLKFHTENMKIHFNLGVAVGAADLVFIFEELAQQEEYSCVLVIVLLYYFNMAVLSWMLIEGLFLYSQVVIVFVSARRWVKYYVIAGWGIPAVVMAISMGILNVQLGTKEICWLSPADNSIWAFAAPAILVIVINFVILVSVVRVIVGIQPDQTNNARVSKVKNAVKGSIFLSPLLGTTWLFGFLSLSHETLLFQYIFASTNSLQGFFLFIFHCVCNSEVRSDFALRWNRKSSTSSYNSTKTPPWFSGTFGLNMASGLRKFRDSISFEFGSSHSTSDNSHDGSDSKATPKDRPAIKDTNRRAETKPNNASSEKKRNSGVKKATRKSRIPRMNRTKSHTITKKCRRPRKRDLGHKASTIIGGDAKERYCSQNAEEDCSRKARRTKTRKSHLVSDKSRRTRRRVKVNLGHRVSRDEGNNIEEQCSLRQEADAARNYEASRARKDKNRAAASAKDVAVTKTAQFSSLLSMPTKNDMIHAGRGNRVAPLSSLAHRNSTNLTTDAKQIHEGRITKHGTAELSDSSVLPAIKWDAEKQTKVEIEKEQNNIAMSYDSGLNSIENESLFEDDDEYSEMPYGKYRVGMHGCDIVI